MSKLNRLKKFLAGSLIGVASYLTSVTPALSPQPARADVVFETVPDKTAYAPGEQVQIEVYADTTQHPSDKIYRTDWQVQVPEGLTPTGAELPSTTDARDFFYGFTRFPGANSLDSTINTQRILESNVRMLATYAHPNDGPSGKRGLLGTYFLNVDANALPGEREIYTLNGNGYGWEHYFPSSAGAVIHNKGTFRITPESSTLIGLGALAGATVLGFPAFRLRKNKSSKRQFFTEKK